VATGAVRLALLAASSSAGLGGDVPAALLGKASASAAPELLAGLGACWQVCAGTGSGLAMAVDRLEEGLRAEQGQRLAVAAELAGPRATAGLLACLPLAGIGLAAALGARPVHVLLHTTIGLACAVLGVGLDGLGVWWTGRLVARVGGAT
jgi:tight adherence protein B